MLYSQPRIFARLRNGSVFISTRVFAMSVEWPDGIDPSYDALYLESRSPTADPGYEHGSV